MPMWIKIFLAKHTNMGFMAKNEREELAKTTKLLSKKDLIKMFPNSKIYGEKILGIKQSLIVIENFNRNL
jgi:hypothetical protein